MIIGKSLTALGGGGLKPEITVTAKAGALLNLHYKDSSIILQSYQLGESETTHTFVMDVSETAYVVEDVTNNASVEVLVDSVAVYNVEIEYKLYLYRDGEFQTPYTYVSHGSGITFSLESNYIYHRINFASTNSPAFYGYRSTNKIDLSNYTKLYCDMAVVSQSAQLGGSYLFVGVGDASDYTYSTYNTMDSHMCLDGTSFMDISGIDDSRYLYIFSAVYGQRVLNQVNNIYTVWLE